MGYYSEKAADQGFDLGDLLPTKASEGAPPDNRYLFHIEEAVIGVSESDKNTGVPYIRARAVVEEPTEFQGYSIFPTLWLTPNADEKQEKANARTRGALRVILGDEGYNKAISQGADFDSTVEAFVDALDNDKPQFVARVGVESEKKAKETGYPARNRINYYYPAAEWGEAVGKNGVADLPF